MTTIGRRAAADGPPFRPPDVNGNVPVRLSTYAEPSFADTSPITAVQAKALATARHPPGLPGGGPRPPAGGVSRRPSAG
jgi:hypothetical protein